ncbi:MAG: phosphohistidine phosphatase SixA [Leptolyngbya sp. SIO4C1]|nr:phosphohistidine phosphatase SixA [Leptolyngbya sp. SIO4C1]
MASSIPTEVYLIRHGIAAERGTHHAKDADRPLTEKGQRRTQRVAERLGELGLSFEALLVSPLVRAQQTADLLLDAGLAKTLTTFEPLAPAGALADWLSWLSDWQQTDGGCVALVGHEPNLSSWAQQLVVGAVTDRWQLKKAGVVGLRVPTAAHAIAHSQLFLWVPPRFLL